MKPNKKLGILAGMGPRSTAPFLELVYDECQNQYGAKYDIDYPQIFIVSHPTPFYIDRPIDEKEFKNSVVKGLKNLENNNVDIIAMPCNSAHAYFDFYLENTNTKLLNIVDETMKSLKGESKRITVIATKMTIDSGLYQKGIIDSGKEYYFDENWQKDINEMIGMIKAKNDIKTISKKYKTLEDKMTENDVDTVILACTDLSVIDFDKMKINITDSSKELAKALIKNYLL